MSTEESKVLVARLQAVKKPIEARRQALWDQLSELRAEHDAAEQELTGAIKDLHAEIGPIDKLLSTANGIKNIKDPEIVASVVDQLDERIRGYE